MKKIQNDPTKIKKVFTDRNISKEQFENLCKIKFVNKNSKTASIKRSCSILTDEEISKIEDRANKDGYYFLFSFLKSNKREIKISYNTFYTRFLSNVFIIQYLINNNFIYSYTSSKHQHKNTEKKEKLHFIVNPLKKQEFLKLIFDNFLTSEEKSVTVFKKKKLKKQKKLP